MSKERRVDPQITVGLLVDRSGFPLDVHTFEGNKAETTTLLPVIAAFQARHQVADMVVVANAGMLSAANLNALEDAWFSFIVAARQSKAPAELEGHFQAHGNYLADDATFEVTRPMGVGKDRRDRRVVWHYLAARARRDRQTLNKQIERAEKIAAGKAPVGKHRFVKLEGATKEVYWGLVERARAEGLQGLLSESSLPGPARIGESSPAGVAQRVIGPPWCPGNDLSARGRGTNALDQEGSDLIGAWSRGSRGHPMTVLSNLPDQRDGKSSAEREQA